MAADIAACLEIKFKGDDMRTRFFVVPFMALTLSATTLPGVALSAPGDQGRIFGVGAPLQLEDLPPGRAKSRLESLPPPARQRALEWLQRFSFPEADLEFARECDCLTEDRRRA